MANLFELPPATILHIALEIPLPRIVNSRFNSIICGNDYFWHDYGRPNFIVSDWKQLYRNYMSTWICGSNHFGQLGLGLDFKLLDIRDSLTQIPNIKAKQVSARGNTTAIIDSENNIWVCGYNENGQLGLGDAETRNILTQISLAIDYTVMIDLEDNVWIWGNFGHDNNPTELRSIPMQILGLKAKQITTGRDKILLIDLNDNVWELGHNNYTPIQILDIKAKQVSRSTYNRF